MTHPLPKVLSAEEWDTKKGAIAKKTGGTTGLTEALDALKIAWVKSDWEETHANDFTKVSSKFTDVAKLWATAEESDKKLFALLHQLQTVESLAKDAADKWGKSKLVPEASAKYVKSVMEAARSERQAVEEKQREIIRFRNAAVKAAKQEITSLLKICDEPMPMNYTGLIRLVREFRKSCLETPNTHLRGWANDEGKKFLAESFSMSGTMTEKQTVLNAAIVKKSLDELRNELS
jgi:hypothetical protein